MLLYLAPMAGITDWPFRTLCFKQGCDVATTEMISAQGYLSAPKKSRAYSDLTARAPYEGPLIAQLFGHEPACMLDAAKKLTDSGRFIGIDINMGCPAQKVTGSGSGSALMKDEGKAAAVVRATVAGTLLPVSVKLRLGWDDQTRNAERIAKIAEQEGAAQVMVHGRTRMQQYSGKADWEAIARVKAALHIPVIANGDISDGASAIACARQTGCDGLAIGRGALGNPWVFGRVKAAFLGEAYDEPTLHDMIQTAKTQARFMRAWVGERAALLEMRKHFAWYVKGFRGAAALRTQTNVAPTMEEAFALLDQFEQKHEKLTLCEAER